MDEKKLTDEVVAKNAITDEEIAKAILQQIEYNAGIPYIDEWLKVKTIKFTEILNFIHRLQSENESLKKQIDELPKPRKKILANKVYSDSTLKKWSKEDLIEQIRILEHNWSCAEESYNNAVKNSEKIFAEQKAEIERLKKVIGSSKLKAKILELYEEIGCLITERDRLEQNLKQCENGYELELHTARFELREARKELEKFEDMRDKAVETCDNCHKKYAKKIEQAVKDTAKEILVKAPNETNADEMFIWWLRERYGVEVE